MQMEQKSINSNLPGPVKYYSVKKKGRKQNSGLLQINRNEKDSRFAYGWSTFGP